MSPAGFSTPTEVAKTTAEGESSGKGAASSSEEPVPEKRERRILKAPPSQRSPYVNVDMRKDFTCNAETNRVYALILLLGGGGGTRRTSQGDDTTCVFVPVATFFLLFSYLHAMISPIVIFLNRSFLLFYRPHIINYRGYICTIKELAQSMRKAGWMQTHVFELGIEAIMYNRHEGSKKIIMPVRFSVREIKPIVFSFFLFWD